MHVIRLLRIVLLTMALQSVLGVATVGATSKSATISSIAGRWKQIPTASLKQSGYDVLNSVSCPSARFCAAVGLTDASVPEGGLYASAGVVPLIETFDGSRWHQVKAPVSDGQLLSVSCPSLRFCVAVGSSSGQDSDELVLMNLNGVWSNAQVSKTSTFAENADALTGVSCVDPTFCVAVGADRDTGTHPGQDNRNLVQDQIIEQWDGKAWTGVSGIGNGWHGGLEAVSCTQGPACVASGYGDPWSYPTTSFTAENGARTEVLEGSSWSSVPGDGASALSCTSIDFCVGVVSPQAPPYASLAQYTSGNWTPMAIPGTEVVTGPPRVVLTVVGVSCVSAKECLAVGRTGNTATKPYGSFYNGKKWSENAITGSRNHVDDQELNAVSCRPNGACVAVGEAGSLFKITSPNTSPVAHSISIVSSGR